MSNKIDIVQKIKDEMEMDDISGNNPYLKAALHIAKNGGFSEIVALLLAAAQNFKPNLTSTNLIIQVEKLRETLALLPPLSNDEKIKLNNLINALIKGN